MDPEKLREELEDTLIQLNLQAAAIQATASEMGFDPQKLRDTNGGFVLAPILGAKAQVLLALTIIETEGDIGPS